jgi:flagellar P-ring protein precursor FlgI
MTRRLAALALLTVLSAPSGLPAQVRVQDLAFHPGAVPRRLVGYGLVVGLDGTGDRSFGSLIGGTMTVRSVVNLLRRFNIEVPAERLRLRNVAAVLVTAEVSPWLRPGGRFEVQVAALGDATSLRGGVLWTTPLVTDPGAPPIGTAQGPVYVEDHQVGRGPYGARGNSGRIPDGGVLETAPAIADSTLALRLELRTPSLAGATAVAAAVNAAYGDSAARVTDPGTVQLAPPKAGTDPLLYLAAIDTLPVAPARAARLVINSREGTVVAGGLIPIGPAVVSHRGITLAIAGAGAPQDSSGHPPAGVVRVPAQASAQDVAAGLHAVGAKPEEIAAIFEALRSAGALNAEVVIR